MNSSQQFVWGNRWGFTLVEVMVTLVVIAIAAALATPSLMEMAPNMALKTAARDLYSKLQEAKMLAIKENTPVTVRFTGSYYYIDRYAPVAYTPAAADTFTDGNGDGLYNPGESYNDVDGDGQYTGDIAINFIDYGYLINYGTGNADKNWSDDPFNQAGWITFNSRGSSNNGSIYIDNENHDVSYGVSIRSAGSIKTWKYSGATPFDKKYWK